ncbi:MAG: hypothetical protein ABSB31_10185 [Dehalococcoidia bacterium]|jgi:hypothetical protein
MKGKIVWITAIGLGGMIVLGISLALPSVLKADNSQTVTMPTAEIAKAYRQALVSPLNKATSEIKDPDLASFTQKLVQSYDLEKTAANTSDPSNLSDLLPDISKIEKNAINMPLKEAGKQLKDKDLSDFYNRFITSCGVDN